MVPHILLCVYIPRAKMQSNWITVGDGKGNIKLELEPDKTLFLEDIIPHYPGTTTLKFLSEGSYKAVKVRVS